MPDAQTLEYLETVKARVVAAQLLAAGTSAWGPLRRLALDVERTIAAGWRELDAMAEYFQERESDYHAQEQAPEGTDYLHVGSGHRGYDHRERGE